MLELEHPTGDFAVEVEVGGTDEEPTIERAALLRTARKLMEGEVYIPAEVWSGQGALTGAAAL